MITMNLQEQLKEKFGFDDFRPGQEAVINALDRYGAALAVFPTGAGKSICYQLPALTYEGVTLVVSPLIALMKDQIDFLRRHGVNAARLDSTLEPLEVRQINDDLFSGRLKLLYVAPERFNNERFLDKLRRTRIALFAIDEAHCISEWGHNFRPDYLKLAEAAKSLGAERVLALTATATPSVVADICSVFNIPEQAAILTGFYRNNLNLCVTPVTPAIRDEVLLKRLKSRKPGPTIVYVTLQKTAMQVAKMLKEAGLSAQPYHAGMDSEPRSLVQDWWMQSESAIVVATIAFGMGIDKSNVRYVYHYNLPKSLESYSQEIGRAGRDGIKSTVEMLACAEDIPALENFVYGDTPTLASLTSLVQEMLSLGSEFDVSQYDLSFRHDIRMLVLRTALTYLELLGTVKQGTPFYNGYQLAAKADDNEINEALDPQQCDLLAKVVRSSRRGPKYISISPAAAASKIGVPREAITGLIEQLEEKQLFSVRASEVRQRYTLLDAGADPTALAADLYTRFQNREIAEIGRLQKVLDLVVNQGCQTNSLVGYFGQQRDDPCGHCSYCVTGRPSFLPTAGQSMADMLPDEAIESWHLLREQNSAQLGEARSAARFLCGISSPNMSRQKLTSHPMFGSLAEKRFGDVLTWCGG
jgi:ATP-dependent DNA helicase RecQ